VDSADSFVFTEKSEYRFVEKSFAYGKLRHEQDKFSGFDHQSIISFGAGHVFTDLGKHKLEVSAGLGYRDLETDARVKEQEAVFDGELKYAYKISETSEFNQNLFVESGNSNTYSKSETFLKLVIVGNLGAKFSYEIKNNSKVPAGTKNTDTITTVTLVYNF
jgi:putative salt-induced outer membrane protein